MKRILIISTLVLLLSQLTFGQDIHFSQTSRAHLNLNPALAGFENDVNVSLNYKTQWNPTLAPYKTYAMSADMLFRPRSRSAVKFASGLFVFRDDAGDPKLSTTNINANFSAKLNITSQQFFSAGLFVGYRQLAIQGADGQWASQYDGAQFDPGITSGEQFEQMSFGRLNSGIGFAYMIRSSNRSSGFNGGKKLTVGGAMFNANRPRNSFLGDKKERLDQRYSVFARGEFGIHGSIVKVSPELYYHQQGKFREIYFGSFMDFNLGESGKYKGNIGQISIGTGLFYRWGDAISAHVRGQYRLFSLGVSYDFNISDLVYSSHIRGGLEFSLAYQIERRRK